MPAAGFDKSVDQTVAKFNRLVREMPTVAQRGAKRIATRVKVKTRTNIIAAGYPRRSFRNFGGTNQSDVGFGVHFGNPKQLGPVAKTVVQPFGPLGIVERGIRKPYIIAPRAATGYAGTLRRGRGRSATGDVTRARRQQVLRRLAKKGNLGTGAGTFGTQGFLYQPEIGGNKPYRAYAKRKPTRGKYPFRRAILQTAIGNDKDAVLLRDALKKSGFVGAR